MIRRLPDEKCKVQNADMTLSSVLRPTKQGPGALTGTARPAVGPDAEVGAGHGRSILGHPK